jgi:hypothetical protein
MQTRNLSSRTTVVFLLGALAVVLMALLISGSMTLSSALPRDRVSIVPIPATLSSGLPSPVTNTPEIRRDAVHLRDHVEVVVKSVDGQLLDAEAVIDGRLHSIRGSGLIPSEVGDVVFKSAGYLPASVRVDGVKVEVVLRPACRVEGAIFDAVTKLRLSGVAVSLESCAVGIPTVSVTTSSEGEFHFDAVASGSYVLHGAPPGYVPLCTGAAARKSGISLNIAGSLRVDVPVYPVYVALCGVHNRTNLSDAVFGSLVGCSFSNQPGPNLPQWFDGEILRTIGETADRLGIVNAYGEACCLEEPSSGLEGQVNFVFEGDSEAESRSILYQPLAQFIRSPVPVWHSLDRVFQTGILTVESPITLRICEGTGIVFGGLETTPGSFTVELPKGDYLVGPIDMNPLLSPELWTRTVSVSGQVKLTIAPAEGFATLSFTGGGEWPHGVLCCRGRGFSMGLPLKNLPIVMPISPGSFDFFVLAAPGSEDSPVWTKTVSVEAGQSISMKVGKN